MPDNFYIVMREDTASEIKHHFSRPDILMVLKVCTTVTARVGGSDIPAVTILSLPPT